MKLYKSLPLVLIAVLAIVLTVYGTAKTKMRQRVIHLSTQPQVADFGISEQVDPFNLIRDTSSRKTIFKRQDGSSISVVVTETIVRRQEASDRVGSLCFHLRPMTIDELDASMEMLFNQLEIPENEKNRYDEWRGRAIVDGDRASRVYFNAIDKKPYRSIGVLRTYHNEKQWYIQVELTWDVEI